MKNVLYNLIFKEYELGTSYCCSNCKKYKKIIITDTNIFLMKQFLCIDFLINCELSNKSKVL
jgi:hypothetical protein